MKMANRKALFLLATVSLNVMKAFLLSNFTKLSDNLTLFFPGKAKFWLQNVLNTF